MSGADMRVQHVFVAHVCFSNHVYFVQYPIKFSQLTSSEGKVEILQSEMYF